MPKFYTNSKFECKFKPTVMPTIIMQMHRIGKVYSSTDLLPCASMTVIANTVPSSLTKLRGRERMTAAVS